MRRSVTSPGGRAGALVAHGLFRGLQAADAQGRASQGFAWRHVVGRLAIHFAREMVAKLVVEIAIGAAGAQRLVEAMSETA